MGKRKYKIILKQSRIYLEYGEISQCIKLLKSALKNKSRRSLQLSMLEQQYKTTEKHNIIGIITYEDYRLNTNKLSNKLFIFIYTLSKKHFKFEHREFIEISIEKATNRSEPPHYSKPRRQ